MTDIDETTPDTLVAGPQASIATGQSILDRVKSRREERVEDETVTLSLPTWDGELRAKYKVVDRSEVEKIMKSQRKVSRNPAAGAMIDADFMVRAVTEVIVHDNDTGEEEVIAPGFTPELASLLGNPEGTDTARGLVFYLVKHNGIALAAHVAKVAKWMMDTSRMPEDEASAGD